MFYVKVNGNLYPATVITKDKDRDWNLKQVKEIYLTMEIGQAKNIFVDDISWSVLEGNTVEDQFIIEQEKDCSDYCLAGPIVDYRDGRISVKMGKLTDQEIIEIITEGI